MLKIIEFFLFKIVKSFLQKQGIFGLNDSLKGRVKNK